MAQCAVCRTPHEHHYAILGRTDRPWRGKSFDAEAAVGNAGVAMMRVLELDPQNRLAFRDFVSHVHIRVYPAEAVPAHQGTDRWSFHVGVSKVIPERLVPALRDATLDAIRSTPGFTSAEPIA